MNNQTLLRAENVHKTYTMGVKALPVLRGVSVEVNVGQTVSIEGLSGSGKSTLLHLLGGLDVPDQGQIYYRGQEVGTSGDKTRSRWRASQFGFVFQSFHLLSELDLLENVILPAYASGSGKDVRSARKRGRELLEKVGLEDRANHRPYELSGGEQQRAALARALINAPEVLLADEPTGNLDSQNGEKIVDLLMQLVKDEGTALVMVTHNPQLAARCHRQYHLRDGVLSA